MSEKTRGQFMTAARHAVVLMAERRTVEFDAFRREVSRFSCNVTEGDWAELRALYDKNRRLKKRTRPFGAATMRRWR